MIDFMLFWGFAFRQTNERTDICTSRVAFATEKQAEKLKSRQELGEKEEEGRDKRR